MEKFNKFHELILDFCKGLAKFINRFQNERTQKNGSSQATKIEKEKSVTSTKDGWDWNLHFSSESFVKLGEYGAILRSQNKLQCNTPVLMSEDRIRKERELR